mgnify:CR=1 FL=1
MHIYDILNEAPFGSTGFKKIGAKIAAKVGAKDTAARMGGDIDRADRTNLIYRRWLSTAGSANINKNEVPPQTLANFMAKQGLPTDALKNQGTDLLDKQVQNVISKAVEKSFDPGATPVKPQASKSKPSSDTPQAVSSAYTTTKKQASKLSAKEKRRLIQQLQKTLPAQK